MLRKPQRRSWKEVHAQITELCYGMCSRSLEVVYRWQIEERQSRRVCFYQKSHMVSLTERCGCAKIRPESENGKNHKSLISCMFWN